MASSSNPQASRQRVIQYPTPEDALLLVSSEGFMYLVNKNAESLLWRHELNTTVYKSHHVNTLDYVDAETNENGKVNLYRYSKDTKTKFQGNIDCTSVDCVGEEFYLNWKTGNRHGDGNLRINRRTYSLSGNSKISIWTLNFSIYTAAYIEYIEGWSIAQPCRVHHTFGNEDFIKFCQDRMNYTFSRGYLKGLKVSDISTVSKIEAGKITIDAPLLNVRGSSKMFIGAYEGIKAAVKRTSLSVGFATIHTSLVESQRHDNISRYFGLERCENGDLLMAFELYYNDFDSVCDSLTFHQLTVVIRGVISGLLYLHGVGLSFGNITPNKVMMSDTMIPKLCGIGNCKPVTVELIAKDFKDLGTFIAYAFCRKLGFKACTEAMYYKLFNDVLLQYLKDADEIEAYDIAAYLIKYGRCSERTILYRPFLWIESRKLDFFRDVNDFMKSNGASKPDIKGEKKPRTHNDYIISNTMRFTAKNDGPDGWMSRFPEIVVNYMKNPPFVLDPQYQPFFVLDLLKFLRNLIAHREQIYLDLDDTDAEDLATEESLIQYIRKMFPPLLTRVFNELERSHIARRKLAKYFEPN